MELYPFEHKPIDGQERLFEVGGERLIGVTIYDFENKRSWFQRVGSLCAERVDEEEISHIPGQMELVW